MNSKYSIGAHYLRSENRIKQKVITLIDILPLKYRTETLTNYILTIDLRIITYNLVNAE